MSGGNLRVLAAVEVKSSEVREGWVIAMRSWPGWGCTVIIIIAANTGQRKAKHLTSPHGNRGLSLGAVSAGERHDGPGLVRKSRSSKGSRHDGLRIAMPVVPGFVWNCLGNNRYRNTCSASTTRRAAWPTQGRPGGCACAMSCLRLKVSA